MDLTMIIMIKELAKEFQGQYLFRRKYGEI